MRLYACGGDGTLNEVVNGAAGHPNAAVTHYAGGSGNDFVRIFSEPTAFTQLPRLLDSQAAEFDLIQCGKHRALNVCSIGFDARIGTSVNRYTRLPFVTGSGAYVLSILVNLLRGASPSTARSSTANTPWPASPTGATTVADSTLCRRRSQTTACWMCCWCGTSRG